ILTSVEFDHADIYRDLAHYESAFARFVRLIPSDGLLAVSAAYPNALRLARECAGRVVTYGGAVPGLEGRGAGDTPRPSAVDYTAGDVALGPDGARFEVQERGRPLGIAALPVGGAHNVENALGVVAAARGLGLAFEEIRPGLATFAGVRRRQEVRATIGGGAVVDDFPPQLAPPPRAGREPSRARGPRSPGRRLGAVFEPRSNTSRRRIHQEDYLRALTQADRVSLRVPEPHDKVPADEQLDVPRLVAGLRSR